MNFTEDIIIGLEVHIELNTDSKLFCGCPTSGSDTPNSRTCQTCLGHPGSKPVVNKSAIEKGIKLALATGCTIAPSLIFSRKSYFYPDLAKNYQITQYEEPLGEQGSLQLSDIRTVGIERIHLEEDPASMTHTPGFSLVDYNRSGNPLAELVTKPEMYSPEEARLFMKKLRTILNYLKVWDVDRCIIKADANVSIKESGYTRVEIKNITGFKEIERALFHEVERQQLIVKEGREIVLETRGWNAEKGVTIPMRLKESEADYGYIIDPDLVPIELELPWIEKLKEDIPELAHEKTDKYTKMGVDPVDAKVLAENRDIAELYDEVSKHIDAPFSAKWIRREVMRVLNFNKKSLHETGIKPDRLIDLLQLVIHKQITEKTAQKLMEDLADGGFDVKEKVEKEGLAIVQDDNQIEAWVDEAIKENSQAVEEFKAGKEKSFNFLVGQVMRKAKGKADPGTIKKLMEEKLK